MTLEINQNLNGHNDAHQTDRETVDIRHYLYLLWNRAWLILLMGLIAGATAYLVSQQITPEYETSTKILINQAKTNYMSSYDSVLTSQQLASTYANMLTTDSLLKAVIDRLGLPTTPEELAKNVTAVPIRDTQLILITVDGTDPQLIATIANSLVNVFIERITSIQSSQFTSSKQALSTQITEIQKTLAETKNSLSTITDLVEKERLQNQLVQYQGIYSNLLTNYEQARLAEAQNTANIVQVNEAQMPTLPYKPNKVLTTALAAFVAVLLTVMGIFMLDTLDDTLKTPDQVTQVLGLPVLGVIVRYDNGITLISQEEPRSPISEGFRALRTNIQYANVDNPVHTIAVTSPSPEDGKTVVSSNLSVVFAQSGKNVILLDADLRRPSVHKRMGLTNSFGLTSLLLEPEAVLKVILEGVIHKAKTAGLSTNPVREFSIDPGGHQEQKAGLMLEKSETEVDVMTVEKMPSIPASDPVMMAKMIIANGVIRKSKTDGLFVITSGDLPPNPTELLGSKKMSLVIEKLKEEVDILVIDAPPVLPVADAAILSTKVDAILLVLKPGSTTITAAKQTIEQLRQVNARIIGVVLNNIDLKASRYNYAYQKGYRYYHSNYHYKNKELPVETTQDAS